MLYKQITTTILTGEYIMSIKKGAVALLFLLIPFALHAVPITYTADMLKPTPKCNIVFNKTPQRIQASNNNRGSCNTNSLHPTNPPSNDNCGGNIYPPHPTNPPAPVPEPTTMLLVGSGMVSIATLRKFFNF
jgi:hypothetical protein